MLILKTFIRISNKEFQKEEKMQILEEASRGQYTGIEEGMSDAIVITSEKIERYAFANSGVRSVVIGKARVIGKGAFKDCQNLQTVILSGVLEIEDEAFANCSALAQVIFSDNLVRIGKNAFSDCINLEKISLGEKLRKIGEEAFSNCSSLKQIKLPADLEEIGDYAFAECTDLHDVNFSGSKLVLYKADEIEFPIMKVGIAPFFLCGSLNFTNFECYRYKKAIHRNAAKCSDKVKKLLYIMRKRQIVHKFGVYETKYKKCLKGIMKVLLVRDDLEILRRYMCSK